MRRKLVIAALVLGVVSVPGSPPGALGSAAGGGIGPFRGLGAWVDIYDPKAWTRPGSVIDDLASRGVRTLYLETANYHRRGPITYPKGVGRFIDLAHARGISVVAWYLPGFIDMKLDWRRTLAALRFTSPGGGRFDGFALDIEATRVKNVSKRTRRMLSLSRRIRQEVGPDYPLGAIHFSPRGLELSPSTWPGFPYAKVADIYDVLMPMTYYSYRAHGPVAVRTYLARSIDIIREATPGRAVPIHAIGGLADASSEAEGRAFAATVREYGLVGASIYDHSIMDEGDWRAFAGIQPNPVQAAALPFTPGTHLDAYGNIPGGDESHPGEVVFRLEPVAGGRQLGFEGFDIGPDEVDVLVNWKPVATLAEGLPGVWTEPRTVSLPDELLSSSRTNVVVFAARGRFPDWSVWGVRGVRIDAAA